MDQDPRPDAATPVAAILHDGRSDVDALLRRFAEGQREAGRKVSGLLMTHRERGPGCQDDLVLTDIETGDEYLVSQRLGQDSKACKADPQGFARASRVLRDALERQPDLVVCNRFGALEAENGGFVAELLALLERGIPVLTVVTPRYLQAWQRFVGEGSLLPVDLEACAAWLEGVRRHRSAPGA
ncbi:MAG: DUF2478 domain-containing protein [Rubrivivax sp.]|nr:DUF2478 domain-containing protein [Rubrivivax sp.]